LIDYYNVLGIQKTADQDQIKKAYRKKAAESHPDKGGDQEVFKIVAEAYAILSDPQKRGRYDRGESLEKPDPKNIAMQNIRTYFVEFLSNDINSPFGAQPASSYLGRIKTKIKSEKTNMQRYSKGLRKSLVFLKKRKNKIVRKDKQPDDLFDIILNQQISMVSKSRDDLSLGVRSARIALKIIKEYEEAPEPDQLTSILINYGAAPEFQNIKL